MLLSKFRLTLLLLFVCAVNAFSQLNVYAYIGEARKDMDKRNYFEAIQKLDIVIEVKPTEYEAYFYRGVCKYILNDNLGAEMDLNSSMSIYNPELYDAYHYRSLVKYRLGDYDGAIKDINHDIDGHENIPELFVERAYYKLSDQNFNGSISDCNVALHLNYKGENVYLCKGMAENAITKYDSALLNFNIALKLNPKDIDVNIHMGMTYYNISKYIEAIEKYDDALKIDSTSTLAYYNRALANLKLTNDRSAMADFNTVINYDPMNAPAYFNRAVLESEKNNFRDAVADFDKVLLLSPKNIQALFNRAKIKTQIKDYQGALADYDATIELYPYLVEAYYERGRLKEMMKDAEGAKADYKLGRVMGELTSVSDTLQRANDSTKLVRLMALNANFTSGNQNGADTTDIELKPLFYLVMKTIKSDCTPILLKKSKKEYLQFCLTNNKVAANNSPEGSQNLLNEPIKDTGKQQDLLLENGIQKTDVQLYNSAGLDYDKILSQDTASAITYFARGINICKETEMLGQLNGNEPATYINKTYKVVNDPATAKYEKAITDFTKVIQLEPKFAYAYYNRAYIKYKMQDLSGAVADYNYALQIDPGFADAYYNRGILLFLLNYKENACEDFSKAGELGLTQAYLIIKLYCNLVTK